MAKVQTRRASAGGISTRDRLKLTARRLFAEHGPGGVTVRDILSASEERNGAGLNYYFRSKDELIREIVVDLFTLMDQRWGDGLDELLSRNPPPDPRDFVRMLVRVSDTSDVEEVPTSARLAHEFSSPDYYDIVTSVMKEYRLSNYDRVLAEVAKGLPEVPAHLMRQRLIFFTRYLTAIFALYEATRIQGSVRRRQAIGVNYEMGNVVDTAMGLISAPVVDAS